MDRRSSRQQSQEAGDVAQLVECLILMQNTVYIYACNASTWEAKFEASLEYMRPCLK